MNYFNKWSRIEDKNNIKDINIISIQKGNKSNNLAKYEFESLSSGEVNIKIENKDKIKIIKDEKF